MFHYLAHGPYIPLLKTATKLFMGIAGTCHIIVDLSSTNSTGQIEKPLIIVEGFNVFDPTTNGIGAYEKQIYDNIDVDINTASPSSDGTPNPVLDNGLDETEKYDVIYVHWDNGTDYIERNAYALETVIAYVNSIKVAPAGGTIQQNVIIGQSMGGVIARFALRDMELNSIAHGTRLFISQDAPQFGANVPVGAQALVQHLDPFQIFNVGFHPFTIGWKDLFPNPPNENGLALLNSAAAKEMLIQNYLLNAPTFGYNYTLTANNSASVAFQTELNTMGWPLNCKNVTLSNGACTGGTTFANNSRIIDFTTTGEGRSMTYLGSLWRSLGSTILSPFDAVGVLNGYGGSPTFNAYAMLFQFPLSLLSTKSTVVINVWFNAVPTSAGQQMYQGDMYIHRVLLGLITVNNYLIHAHANSTSDMLPIDNAQGGKYDLDNFGINAGNFENNLPGFFKGYINTANVIIQSEFCFVPTASSSAIGNIAQNYGISICNAISCSQPAQVQDYYVPPVSQVHTSFTQDNSNWILKIQDAAYACNKVCPTSLAINGDTAFCTVSDAYTLANVPNGLTYSWTVTPTGSVTITTPNAASTTLTEQDYGPLTLNALVTNPHACGLATSFTVSKNVSAATVPNIIGGYYNSNGAQVPMSAVGVNQVCLVGRSAIMTTNMSILYPGTVTWGGPVGGGIIWSQTGENLTINFRAASPAEGFFCTATNSCGSTEQDYSFQAVTCADDAAYTASPNPATNTVTVSSSADSTASQTADLASDPQSVGTSSVSPTTKAMNSTPKGRDIQQITIFDLLGHQVNKIVFSANTMQVQINVRDMASGVYFFEINDSNHRTVTKKVIVQH